MEHGTADRTTLERNHDEPSDVTEETVTLYCRTAHLPCDVHDAVLNSALLLCSHVQQFNRAASLSDANLRSISLSRPALSQAPSTISLASRFGLRPLLAREPVCVLRMSAPAACSRLCAPTVCSSAITGLCHSLLTLSPCLHVSHHGPSWASLCLLLRHRYLHILSDTQ